MRAHPHGRKPARRAAHDARRLRCKCKGPFHGAYCDNAFPLRPRGRRTRATRCAMENRAAAGPCHGPVRVRGRDESALCDAHAQGSLFGDEHTAAATTTPRAES